MIKQRDFWMPFAPVVRRARAHEYFDNPKDLPSPYMMLTFDTKANFRDLIAAVHNADLTARPQILERAHNPDLDRLLVEFEAQTGRGVLLNTSFNLHGSPIVRGPAEALAVFRESGLEFLALGRIRRRQARPDRPARRRRPPRCGRPADDGAAALRHHVPRPAPSGVAGGVHPRAGRGRRWPRLRC